MAKNSYQERLGFNSTKAVFMCGHKSNIYFKGEQMMLKMMAETEKKLCPDCRKERLKKVNKHVWIPFWYYREHLEHARNIITGGYNKETKEIEVWLPPKKLQEYVEYINRIYYEIHNSPIQNNKWKKSLKQQYSLLRSTRKTTS